MCMKNKRRRERIRNAVVILGMVTVLMYIFRIWPLLFLLILAVIVLLILNLFIPEDKDEGTGRPKLEPTSKNATESDVWDLAYTVMVRRINELVEREYPGARWTWETPKLKMQVMNGNEVFIRLNHAGGYRRARVFIRNLELVFIEYESAEDTGLISVADKPAQDMGPEPKNYELAAFEWVDANIVALNKECNEAIGQGFSEVLLTEDQLPEREVWSEICKELICAGLPNAVCDNDGITIKLTQESAERESE